MPKTEANKRNCLMWKTSMCSHTIVRQPWKIYCQLGKEKRSLQSSTPSIHSHRSVWEIARGWKAFQLISMVVNKSEHETLAYGIIPIACTNLWLNRFIRHLFVFCWEMIWFLKALWQTYPIKFIIVIEITIITNSIFTQCDI